MCHAVPPSVLTDSLPPPLSFLAPPPRLQAQQPSGPLPTCIWATVTVPHQNRRSGCPSFLPLFSRAAKFRRMYFRPKSVFRTVATLCGCEASGSPGRDGRHGRRDRGRSPAKSPLPQLSLHGRWPARAPSWVAAVLPRTARLAAAPHDGGGERGTTVILSVSEGRLGGDGARLAAFGGGCSGAAADGDSCSGRQ